MQMEMQKRLRGPLEIIYKILSLCRMEFSIHVTILLLQLSGGRI